MQPMDHGLDETEQRDWPNPTPEPDEEPTEPWETTKEDHDDSPGRKDD